MSRQPCFLRKIALFSGLTALFFSFNASFAAKAKQNLIDRANNSIEAELMGLYMYYEEVVNGTIVDKESGIIPGFGIVLNKTFGPIFLNLNGAIFQGKLKYEGGYTSGLEPSVQIPFEFKHKRTVYDFSAKLGYQVRINSYADLIPFVELGYYEWDRFIVAPPVPNGVSLDEVYMNYYAGIGTKFNWQIGSNWVISPTFSIGSTLSPKMDATVLGEKNTFALGSKLYYKLGLKTLYFVTDHLSISGQVYYRSFEYGKSSNVLISSLGGYFFEPDSTTNHLGFGIGVSYNF